MITPLSRMLLRAAPVLLLALLLPSCKQSTEPATDPAPVTNPQFVTEAADTIGPAGGTVQVKNAASPLYGVKVVFPGGALSQRTLITISSAVSPPSIPSGLQKRGPYAVFGPEGLTFPVPVLITMPSTTSNLPNSTDLIFDDVGNGFRPISTPDSVAETHGQTVNPQTGEVTAAVSHFSGRQLLGTPGIETLLNGPGQFGQPILIPIDPSKSVRCKPRTAPISRIIIHSTNDGGANFADIIAWIEGSIGDNRIIYNDKFDTKGHYAEAFFATYYIDKDGKIIQIVPDNIQTSHIAGQNTGSIGIELYDGGSGYTPLQIQALDSLTAKLMAAHHVPVDSVKRHKDYTGDPLHQDPYRWTDFDWNSFKTALAAGQDLLSGVWIGSWNWSGPGNNGCQFSDGGSFSMMITQSGTRFTGADVSLGGIQTRSDADCSLQSTDAGSGGTANGSLSGSKVYFSFSVTSLTTLTFTANGTLNNNTLTGTIVRTTGGSGAFALTKQ